MPTTPGERYDVITPDVIPNVTDERLCWLVLRDELSKRSSKRGFLGWFGALITRNVEGAEISGVERRGRRSERMTHYSIAVDASAQKLSAEERQHLRTTAQVPDWFRPDVQRRYEEIRKRR
ncbi:hypothetical protein [Streptomyces sp. NPDC096324]|uniref:hypothetical protein n=1 Tax=Streptomyces sp. NPDC096324 TaxID=3366085 RepID=UPI0038102349